MRITPLILLLACEPAGFYVGGSEGDVLSVIYSSTTTEYESSVVFEGTGFADLWVAIPAGEYSLECYQIDSTNKPWAADDPITVSSKPISCFCSTRYYNITCDVETDSE